MKTTISSFVLSFILAMMLSSCGFTQLENYPERWPEITKKHCPNLSGTYSYFGRFSPSAHNDAPIQPEFDSWVLSKRINLTPKKGDYVVLAHEINSGVIRAKFFKASGELIGDLTENHQCGPDGYLRTKQYESAGEGMQGRAEVRINLLTTDSGSLIVHVRRTTEATALFVLPASGVTENWVEFEKKAM